MAKKDLVKRGEDRKKVEAVLFAVGKEITSERIASLCSLEVKETESLVSELVKDYDNQNNSLKIIQKENGWKLTVMDEYVPLVSSIVSSTELENSMMQTLAVIAWQYPVVQSEIIKIRGSGAYEHMKALEEQGFIAKERFGRTFKVKLTKKFFGYFDLPSEEAKQAFLDQIPSELLLEAEEVNKEIDEVERLSEKQDKEAIAEQEIRKAMGDVKKD